MFDDGFINLRVVRHIEAGHGPVYNFGQRVEAYTSALWIGVLTVADFALPIRLEWISVGGGILLTAAGVALGTAGSARLVRVRDADGWLVPAGALVVVAIYPMWYFASSGLETGLTLAWLGAVTFSLGRWASANRRLGATAAVVLGLGWLIRPDLLIVTAAAAVVVLIGQRADDTGRSRVGFVFALLAVPLAYQLFRMGYFASLVPNTALAKEASAARWGRGWVYFRRSFAPFWTWLPVALLVVGAYFPLVRGAGPTRTRLVTLAMGASAVLSAAYVIRVGGDYILARLLLPSFFLFCAPVMVIPLRRRIVVAVGVAGWAVIALFVLRPSRQSQYSALLTAPSNAVTIGDFGMGPHTPLVNLYSEPGLYYEGDRIADQTPGPRSTVVGLYGIGGLGYALGPDVSIFDELGLADPITARFQIDGRSTHQGHEKPVPGAWASARLSMPGHTLPASEFPPVPFLPSLTPATTGTAFRLQVKDARAALRCPRLRSLGHDVTDSISLSGLLHNMVHSFGNTTLRIDPDPAAAKRQFCG